MSSKEYSSNCTHYMRKCSLVTPCCSKSYICRVCHDEAEDHILNRNAVNEVICLQCDKRQEVGRNCSNCGILFGKYSCLKCKLFDDVDKKQFHCDGCGICRVGGGENFYHCDKCDMCMGINLRNNHKCLEKVSHRNCPVCLEDIHTSRKAIHVPKCTHLIHGKCLDGMLKNGLSTCPICYQSLCDMTNYWKLLDEEVNLTIMPAVYQNYKVNILCRDCHKESKVSFHVIALKCMECGGYNTTRIGGDDPLPEEQSQSHVFFEASQLEVSELEQSWETISDEEVENGDHSTNTSNAALTPVLVNEPSENNYTTNGQNSITQVPPE